MCHQSRVVLLVQPVILSLVMYRQYQAASQKLKKLPLFSLLPRLLKKLLRHNQLYKNSLKPRLQHLSLRFNLRLLSNLK